MLRAGAQDAGLRAGARDAGLLIEPVPEQDAFVAGLADAMLRMCDDGFRQARAADAEVIGQGFAIDRCAERYVELYRQTLAQPRRFDFSARASAGFQA